ncbi:MAG: putative ABC-type multidrug transport system, ATPase and permease component [Frankiales bacterium]|nr:putative ABC-type multidrug transport system, ATPase and permease component [Frankiales bacterium]
MAKVTLPAGPPVERARSLLRTVRASMSLVARADRRTFGFAISLQVVGALSSAVLVLASKLTIDAVTGAGPLDVHDLIFPIVLLSIASAVASSAGILQSQQQRLLGECANRDVWGRLVGVASRVDLETFEEPAFYDRVERLTNNAIRQPLAIATSVLNLAGGLVGAASLVVALALIQPLLLVPIVLAVFPAVLVSRKAAALEFDFAQRHSTTARWRGYYRALMLRRDPATELRAFGLRGEFDRRHQQISDDYIVELRRHVARRQRYGLLTAAVTAALLSAALLLLVVFLQRGWLGIGEAGAAAIAIRLLSSQFGLLVAAVGSIIEGSVFMRDFEEFLADTPVQPDALTTGWPLTTGLALRDVRYRYPAAADDALRGVDLDVRPGEIVALVGENGSGKTTLAKIVAGLYRPADGEIAWDGEGIADDNRADLRASVAVIFQDFMRYAFTVRDNVALGDVARLGDPGLDDQVAAALARSGADYAFPRGLDTHLSTEYEGGIQLSGGQWQRIAVARALFRAAPLVVLDEPTSALDPRSEHRLFSAVRTLLQGRAAILVSHRYANLHLADRIYVLQDGRIVEHGSHDELMAQGGVYAQLYRLQADAYLAPGQHAAD